MSRSIFPIRNQQGILACLLGLCLCSLPVGFTQEQANPKGKAKARPNAEITPEREAASLTFARLNHQELVDLLETLKTTNPKEYQIALRDLYRASERLGQIKDRDAELYELELSLWQVNSKIRLEVAKAMMRGDEDQRAKSVRPLLRRRREIRLEIARLNRKKVEQELVRINAEIAKQESSLKTESADDAELKTLLKTAKKGKKASAGGEPKRKPSPMLKEKEKPSASKAESSNKSGSEK